MRNKNIYIILNFVFHFLCLLQVSHFYHFSHFLPLCLSLPRLVCLSGRLSLGLSVSLGNPSGPGISMRTSLVIAFSTAHNSIMRSTSCLCSSWLDASYECRVFFGLFSARQRLAFWGMQQLQQYPTTTTAIVVATLGKLASSAQPINPKLDQEPRLALHCGFLFAFLQLFFFTLQSILMYIV